MISACLIAIIFGAIMLWVIALCFMVINLPCLVLIVVCGAIYVVAGFWPIYICGGIISAWCLWPLIFAHICLSCVCPMLCILPILDILFFICAGMLPILWALYALIYFNIILCMWCIPGGFILQCILAMCIVFISIITAPICILISCCTVFGIPVFINHVICDVIVPIIVSICGILTCWVPCVLWIATVIISSPFTVIYWFLGALVELSVVFIIVMVCFLVCVVPLLFCGIFCLLVCFFCTPIGWCLICCGQLQMITIYALPCMIFILSCVIIILICISILGPCIYTCAFMPILILISLIPFMTLTCCITILCPPMIIPICIFSPLLLLMLILFYALLPLICCCIIPTIPLWIPLILLVIGIVSAVLLILGVVVIILIMVFALIVLTTFGFVTPSEETQTGTVTAERSQAPSEPVQANMSNLILPAVGISAVLGLVYLLKSSL